MTTETELPPGLEPAGEALEFTERTLPEALLRDHALPAGRWARLTLLSGRLRFVDLATGQARLLSAPQRLVIAPQAPHRLQLDGELRGRLEFLRAPGSQ